MNNKRLASRLSSNLYKITDLFQDDVHKAYIDFLMIEGRDYYGLYEIMEAEDTDINENFACV